MQAAPGAFAECLSREPWGGPTGRPAPSQQLLLVVFRARGALAHLLVPLVGEGFHLDTSVVEVLGQKTQPSPHQWVWVRSGLGLRKAVGGGRGCFIPQGGRVHGHGQFQSLNRLTEAGIFLCRRKITGGVTQKPE